MGALLVDETPYGGHPGPVTAVAYSPDGTTLATAGLDRTVRLWDAHTGQHHTTLTGHTGQVLSVAYSPDSTTLATASDDGTVRLWDAHTGQHHTTLTGHTNWVRAIAYSPDGTTLATASDDHTVRLWDTHTGQHHTTLARHTNWPQAIAYSPDGTTLATASNDHTVRLWDTHTGQHHTTLTGHTGQVLSVAYSPDGTTLATASNDHTVRLWDAHTGQHHTTLTGHTDWVRAIAYSPDGTTLATASDDGTVRLWDAHTGQHHTTLTGHTNWVRAIAYSPDGTTLATASNDGTVRLWDAHTGQHHTTLTGHTGQVLSVAYSPDGTTLATASNSGTVRLWDAHTGQHHTTLTGHTDWVLAVAYSPDGTTLATASDDHTVRLWDAHTGQHHTTLTGHTNWVRAVAYSPDSTTLATASDDHTVRLWDAHTGQHHTTLTGHTNWVRAIAYSPDGTTLATASDDHTVRLWDAHTGQHHTTLTGHTDWLRAVAYSPDGTTLATASSDGTVRLWDAHTGQHHTTLIGHTGQVLSVAYSPDGTTLATASDDGTVRLWDAHTGQHHTTLTGHTGGVLSVAYSPDGTTLATVGDTTIRIWNPRTGRQTAGTGFGGRMAPARPLPGIHDDRASGTDLIGVSEDVDVLATLLTAEETALPLAIALLGEWGSGKSSMMEQVCERVRLLAENSRNNLGDSAYLANIRQVRFNAWHYSDDDVWTGLIQHLFRELARDTDQHAPDPQSTRTARDALRHSRDRLAADEERLGQAIALVAPGARTSAHKLRRVLPAAIHAFLISGRGWLATTAGWAIVALVCWRLWYYLDHVHALVVAAIGLAATPPVAFTLQVRRRLRQATEKVRAALQSQQRTRREERQRVDARLIELDAAERLSAFLTERRDTDPYQSRRGLIGQVHHDLDTLSENLARAQAQWRADPIPDPPLQRIVLYIDDLDRCTPRRVVEVLSAVHLMLALPLFAVVVAVDPRWILGALHHHYHELFEGGSPEYRAATPLDYLDKIFQIPYAVPPLTPERSAAYLASLLPPTVLAPTAPPPVPAASPAQHARDETPDFVEEAATKPPVANQAANSPRPKPGRDRLDYDGLSRSHRDDLSPDAAVILRPLGLEISPVESRTMIKLNRLVATPRAAKRLVNLYRLVRIGMPADELGGFLTDRTYEVVQVILAMLVGQPAQSSTIVTAIMQADPDTPLETLLGDDECVRGVEPDQWVATTKARSLISTVLHHLTEAVTPGTKLHCIRNYQTWCERLIRYSFHTRHLAETDSG